MRGFLLLEIPVKPSFHERLRNIRWSFQERNDGETYGWSKISFVFLEYECSTIQWKILNELTIDIISFYIVIP